MMGMINDHNQHDGKPGEHDDGRRALFPNHHQHSHYDGDDHNQHDENLVSMTMVEERCSQTIRQKSASVSGSGPCCCFRSLEDVNLLLDDFCDWNSHLCYHHQQYYDHLPSIVSGLQAKHMTAPLMITQVKSISSNTSCISAVFTVSVGGRIYRSQGLGRSSSVWYSSATLCLHSQTQPHK